MMRKSCQKVKYFKDECPTWRCVFKKPCTTDCRHYVRRIKRRKKFSQ